jgi:hypothetical protein
MRAKGVADHYSKNLRIGATFSRFVEAVAMKNSTNG